jgi:ssDNA-binding Zn-finger/Zn-ribbon topoisomerase 1
MGEWAGEENGMRPFEKCPVCGGELLEKEVDAGW